MKVYRVEAMVIDFDDLGADGIKSELENTRYPNDCMAPSVVTVEGRDIGEWSDDHPLNSKSQSGAEYARLFGLSSEAMPQLLAEPNKQEGSPAIPATSVSAGVVEPVARVVFTRRPAPDVEWLVTTVHAGTLLYTHPPVEVDGLLRQALTDNEIIKIFESAGAWWEGPDMCDFLGEFKPMRIETARKLIAALRQHLSANSKGG